jgi:signal transduction histidine kinase
VKLATRLLLPLVATVVAVMGAYGVWTLIQRETIIRNEAEREITAYARALGLAVERVLQDPDVGNVAEIVERVDREPAIYGILVYDRRGILLEASEPVDTLARAPVAVIRATLTSMRPTTLMRSLGDVPVVSVVRPLVDQQGDALGVLEVVQPLASIAAEESRIRRRFVLNTLTLLLALGLVVTWLVRRHVSAPLERFVQAVRALGAGNLGHRMEPELAAGELGEVADELNRMADRLEGAREDLLAETADRIALERRLRQSEAMAEIGTLAAGLAHEIGAPLHVIRGRADLLRRTVPGPEDLDRNLRIVVEQIDRISHIVRNLLGYARRREPRPVPTDLAELARQVAEFLDAEAARTDTALTVRAPAPVVVRVDPDLMHQVLLNLAMNALQALEGRTGERKVRFAVGPGTPEGDGEGATIDVDDTGPGVPTGLRDRIFDPFFTTKAGRHGTGLGLAVARNIVADHGGAIRIVDAPSDDGARWSTRLQVILPAPDGHGS